jgi:tRNA/rRNA methyltransferase
MVPLDNFTFVLVRPLQAGNIGAAARALKNMGLRDLRLVAPVAWRGREAAAMAVHAADVLSTARSYDELAAAVADCTLVVGSTCRPGLYRAGAMAVREAAAQLVAEAVHNRIAVVFGPEDTGLVNLDLALCQRLITIPTAPEYPSLNLAQAVMVVAYELVMAAGTVRDLPAAEPYAPAAEVEAMMQRMSRALVAIGFLPADHPDHIMFTLRALLGRAGLGARDLQILNGIARQILWFAESGLQTAEAKRGAGKKLR